MDDLDRRFLEAEKARIRAVRDLHQIQKELIDRKVKEAVEIWQNRDSAPSNVGHQILATTINRITDANIEALVSIEALKELDHWEGLRDD